MSKATQTRDMIKDTLSFCVGKKNAMTSRHLESLVGCASPTVRKVVNELRAEGMKICSGRNGYYIARNDKEVSATIRQMESRIAYMQKAIEGLRR